MTQKFLLVDDLPEGRQTIRHLLESPGHADMLIASSAEHALDVLRERTDVRCVITGTKLSNLGGLGLIKAIRENEAWKHVRTLAIIEMGDEATITLAASLGASGYIEKPLRVEILRKKLAFILALRPEELAE